MLLSMTDTYPVGDPDDEKKDQTQKPPPPERPKLPPQN